MSTPAASPVAALVEAGRIPTLVLGGSGYVAGELMRLLATHPGFGLAAVASSSRPGEAVEGVFPHLGSAFPGLAFVAPESLRAILPEAERWAVFSAAPHGASAPLVERLLGEAAEAGVTLSVVDLSADLRLTSEAVYERIYRREHPAPDLLGAFTCAVPEHLPTKPRGHVAHPGCFVTATLLAAVPLIREELVEPDLSVVAVTGSTGAGRTPTATTHHPERRSTLFAYSPLKHRHAPEMRALLAAATGTGVDVRFIPQSGPFARGIYATVQGRMREPLAASEVAAVLAAAYEGSPFVGVQADPPRLHDVVGTNRCRLSVATEGRHLAVFAALDNLMKGAAGGAMQWMNRLFGLPEATGLAAPGLGWL